MPGSGSRDGTNHTIPPKSPQQPNVNILRIDLTRPQIEFFSTPWDQLSPHGTKTTEFLRKNFGGSTLEMFGTNANFFDMNLRSIVYGLALSRGQLSGFALWSQCPYAVVITKNNQAVMGTIDPGEKNDLFEAFAGVLDGSYHPWTAIAGSVYILHKRNVVTDNQVAPQWRPVPRLAFRSPRKGRAPATSISSRSMGSMIGSSHRQNHRITAPRTRMPPNGCSPPARLKASILMVGDPPPWPE